MLPYGTLWKLDQLLHTAERPQRRTAALRRRQALFYFLWGISLVSVFLVPYHYASLRRLRIDHERELLGLVAPAVDLTQLRMREDEAMQRLRTWSTVRWGDVHNEGNAEDGVGDPGVTADFALVFYHHPSSRTHLNGMFAHPYIRELMGGGAGVLWPRLGDAAEAPAALPHVLHARTLSEVAVEAARNGSRSAKCLISLRRDALQEGVHGTENAGRDDLIRALQATLSQEAGLHRMAIGVPPAAGEMAADARDGRTATEKILAALFLWLASRHTCSHAQEEAISHALAACQAPLSHFLWTSFEWGAPPGGSRATTTIKATVQEEETEPQYLCLCSKHGVLPPDAFVEPSSGTVTPLFLVDPAGLEPSARTCADACLRGG
ncbi:hypothetical protein LSCM1_00816 [Leishmania martiniquensis]|uniref:Uncharacterized protein n=1 Tax=Leishmania martiniquensis TaxID=1580590 RepID=A0A836FPI1_9TRYP|nr:hypothetical protein LSCM1_00816 [Leishmania martiniquensis]